MTPPTRPPGGLDDPGVRAAAAKALDLVPDGARVGLGSGRAASAFIAMLGARVREGLRAEGVPTSRVSAVLARDAGIPIVELGVNMLDLTVDGADEVAPDLDLVKGWGGALVRERIVAAVVILIHKGKQIDRNALLDGALRSAFQQLLDLLFPEWPIKAKPEYPFRHLENDGVWKLVPIEGASAELRAARASHAEAWDVLRHARCAQLDEEIFARLAANPAARTRVIRILGANYFPGETTMRLWDFLGEDLPGPVVPVAAEGTSFTERALEEHLETHWHETPLRQEWGGALPSRNAWLAGAAGIHASELHRSARIRVGCTAVVGVQAQAGPVGRRGGRPGEPIHGIDRRGAPGKQGVRRGGHHREEGGPEAALRGEGERANQPLGIRRAARGAAGSLAVDTRRANACPSDPTSS